MYKGIIKKSRTLDLLAVFAVFSAIQPILIDVLAKFNIGQRWISLVDLIFIGFLAYLRYQTKGPVGVK
jgi:hypothetical protein